MTSSSTTPSISLDFSRHSRVMRFLLFLELVGLIAKLGGLFEILLGHGGFFFLVELLDLCVEFLQIRRPGHGFEANAGPGFVDDVDGLIRQIAAADVAVGKLDGGLPSARP